MAKLIGILCLGILFGPPALAKEACHKSGEPYTLENMNLPACEGNGKGGTDPFKSGAQPQNVGAGAAVGGAAANNSSGTSGTSPGSGGSAAGSRSPASTTSGSTAPQGTASSGIPYGTGAQPTPAAAPQDSYNSPGGSTGTNDNSGDAHWIK